MIKLFIGGAGSGKTYNIKKDIEGELKKNPLAKVHIIGCIDEYNDIKDKASDFEFVNINSSIIVGNYKKRDDINILVIDGLFNEGIDHYFLSNIIEISDYTDIFIAIQQPNDILFEIADMIHFCERENEGSIKKAYRLKEYQGTEGIIKRCK